MISLIVAILNNILISSSNILLNNIKIKIILKVTSKFFRMIYLYKIINSMIVRQ